MLEHLKNRRTRKIIANSLEPDHGKSPEPLSKPELIDELLSAAGNAPFHYACDRIHRSDEGSCVPWRVFKLNKTNCNILIGKLIEAGDTTKVPNMLAAADHLLQVTWLPDEGTIAEDSLSKEAPVFDGTLRNMEHIAAAGAFIQSLLLAAEDAGFKTYWSSGGPLRGKQVFEWLDIPDNQLLLGSIFLYPQSPQDAVIKPGALAEKRGKTDDWSYQCDIS